MYNLPLLVLMCYVLKPYALRLPTTTVATASAPILLIRMPLTLYCAVLYILLV